MFRTKILTASFPPNYGSDYELFTKLRDSTNCYAYALQLPVPLDRETPNYDPGFLCGIRIYQDHYQEYQKNIIKGLLGDCEILGINIKQIGKNTKLSNNAYRIALGYVWNNYHWQFHFLRENIDGTWSEKIGWKQDVNNEFALEETTDHFRSLSYYSLSRK